MHLFSCEKRGLLLAPHCPVLPEFDGQHPDSHPPAAFFIWVFEKDFFGFLNPFVHIFLSKHFAGCVLVDFLSIQCNDCSHFNVLAFMCFFLWGIVPFVMYIYHSKGT